jgi:hypothetical protein
VTVPGLPRVAGILMKETSLRFNSESPNQNMPKGEKPGNRSHYVTSTLSGERVRAFVPPPPSWKALDVRESSGKRRDRLFLYENYLDILNQES